MSCSAVVLVEVGRLRSMPCLRSGRAQSLRDWVARGGRAVSRVGARQGARRGQNAGCVQHGSCERLVGRTSFASLWEPLSTRVDSSLTGRSPMCICSHRSRSLRAHAERQMSASAAVARRAWDQRKGGLACAWRLSELGAVCRVRNHHAYRRSGSPSADLCAPFYACTCHGRVFGGVQP